MKTRGITATVIFESSAVNRDDKLGGNITSIKKMTRPGGVYSYMSRAFIRHHLFSTLYQQFDWQPAPVTKTKPAPGSNAKEVIQFDFPRANIIDYPEMDLFGFMSTTTADKPKAKGKKAANEEASAEGSSPDEAGSESEKGLSLVRKAPLGITKAISLEPWQADMSFNANHDLVERALSQGKEADPNPFQKEEHHSLYRVSFTLDLCRTGFSVHYFNKLPKYVEEWIIQNSQESTQDEMSMDTVAVFTDDKDGNWRKICDKENKIKGFIGVYNNKLVFVVEKNERTKRIENLLYIIKNGLSIHSSTESYGLVPKLLVVATLSLPVPVFHSSFEIKNQMIDIGQLEHALSNDYVQKAWYSSAQAIPDATGKLTKLTSIEDVMTSLE